MHQNIHACYNSFWPGDISIKAQETQAFVVFPSLHRFVYSTNSQDSQIKESHLKVTKRDISPNVAIDCYTKPDVPLPNMWLANIERVHEYLVPESCMQILSCIRRRGCSDLYSGKTHDLCNPGACSCREKGYCGNRHRPRGQRYAKHFNKFEIKIMSPFKSNETWFQTSI